jgi:hypothetical protein
LWVWIINFIFLGFPILICNIRGWLDELQGLLMHYESVILECSMVWAFWLAENLGCLTNLFVLGLFRTLYEFWGRVTKSHVTNSLSYSFLSCRKKCYEMVSTEVWGGGQGRVEWQNESDSEVPRKGISADSKLMFVQILNRKSVSLKRQLQWYLCPKKNVNSEKHCSRRWARAVVMTVAQDHFFLCDIYREATCSVLIGGSYCEIQWI